MLYVRLAAVVLAIVVLASCPIHEHLESRLYVVEASEGGFQPTDESGVYLLTTSGFREEVTWFSDRPVRDAGTEPFLRFVDSTWPMYFDDDPAAGIALRSGDGVWSITTGQILDAEYDEAGATLTWRVRLRGTPDLEPLTGVVVYLDDKGALEPDDESHVFLHAAAEGWFTVSEATVNDRPLLLNLPLQELIVLGIAPEYDAALEHIETFVDATWPAAFAEDPPNAAVTVEGPDGVLETTPVILSNPRWDAEHEQLSYDVSFLHEQPSYDAGPTLIFIDSYDDEEDTTIYQVVIKLPEEYYSIWPADRELPLGWEAEGFVGHKQECLDHIMEVWTDMRPRSLRDRMRELEEGT